MFSGQGYLCIVQRVDFFIESILSHSLVEFLSVRCWCQATVNTSISFGFILSIHVAYISRMHNVFVIVVCGPVY